MPELTDLGLSAYEARVYRTLLSTGPATAKELSRASAVPMGRIYDVLNSLEGLGMVRSQTAGRPKKYAGVESTTALDRLLETRRCELEAEIDRYEAIVDELTDQLDTTTPADEQFWTVAIGPEESTELLVKRLSFASDRLVVVADAPSPQLDLRTIGERIADAFEAALERGVTISVLATPGVREAVPDGVLDRFDELVAQHSALDVRIAEGLSGSFYLIDRTEVCIDVPNPLQADEPLALVALVDPGFADSVFEEFQPRWDRARPLLV